MKRLCILLISMVSLAVASFAFEEGENSSPVSGDGICRTVQEIKQLSSEESGREHQVIIEAQVIHMHPGMQRLFVHDGEAGLYVQTFVSPGNVPGLKIGSRVRIEGTTRIGGFSPIIFTDHLSIIGWEPLAAAPSFDRDMLWSTTFDVERVEASGRIIGIEYAELYKHLIVTMEVFDSTMDVYVPYTKNMSEKMEPLLFRQVRVPAVLGTMANTDLQMTGRILYANSADDFVLVPEVRQERPQYVPIHELMRYGQTFDRLVKTRGTIIHTTPDKIYLRGEHGNLKAAVYGANEYQPGAEVELVGYAHPQPISPSFWTIEINKVGGSGPPEPVKILLDEHWVTTELTDELDETPMNPAWNNELVSLDAEFVYSGKTFASRRSESGRSEQDEIEQVTLWCQSGPLLFESRLPPGVPIPESLRPGSQVRLIGICHLTQSKDPRLGQMTESLWLEIPDVSSIEILKAASWWTPRRLLWGLIIMLSVSLLFLVWVLALHKTVDRQTGIIREKVEHETILDERQRIARELHDNLDQGLTGAAIHLQGCRRLMDTNTSKFVESVKNSISLAEQDKETLKKHLENQLTSVEKDTEVCRGELQALQDLLTYCGEESRSHILDLRGGLLERMDLPAALQEALKPLAVECGAELSISVEGCSRRLKLVAERNLLLLAKEAVTNAARHAAPEHIRVKLLFAEDSISLTVADDGTGFLVDQLPRAGRFGLKGMHERAAKLGADFCVDSKPGEGAIIKAELSPTAEWELS